MPIVQPSMARPTLTEPTYVAPPVVKTILAWAGVVMGGLMLVAALGTLGSGVLEPVAMALIGLSMLVPGSWWLYCERRDRTHAEEDFRLDRQAALAARSMAGFVSPNALSPLTWDTPLVPFARRWPVVGTASGVLFALGVVLMPGAEAASSSSFSSPVTSISTVTTTARAAAPRTTVTEIVPSPRESAVPAAVAEPEPAPAEPAPPAQAYPQPEPSAPPQTYAPAPLVHQAPQAAYYPNCAAARAAGVAPLLRGEPGYAPNLDRDNDGIACE